MDDNNNFENNQGNTNWDGTPIVTENPSGYSDQTENYGYSQSAGPYGSQDQSQYQSQYQPQYQPQYGDIPPEIRKWNWGAFMFNIIWGIGNHAYLAFLTLVPCLGVIWVFVCGAKGNEWAWRSGEFKDVETFFAVQKTWNRAGFVYFIFMIAIVILYIIIIALFGVAIFSAFQNSGLSGLNSISL